LIAQLRQQAGTHFRQIQPLPTFAWGAPNPNILAGTSFPEATSNAAHQGFGIISTTAIPLRQLQLGIKYSF